MRDIFFRLSLEDEGTDIIRKNTMLLEVDKYLDAKTKVNPEELYDRAFKEYKDTGSDVTEINKPKDDVVDPEQSEAGTTNPEDQGSETQNPEDVSASDKVNPEDKDKNDGEEDAHPEDQVSKKEDEEKHPEDVSEGTDDDAPDDDGHKKAVKNNADETREEEALESLSVDRKMILSMLSSDKDITLESIEEFKASPLGYSAGLVYKGVSGLGSFLFTNEELHKLVKSTGSVAGKGVLGLAKGLTSGFNALSEALVDTSRSYHVQLARTENILKTIAKLKGANSNSERSAIKKRYSNFERIQSLTTPSKKDFLENAEIVHKLTERLVDEGIGIYRSNALYFKRVIELTETPNTNISNLNIAFQPPLSAMKPGKSSLKNPDTSVYDLLVYPDVLPGSFQIVSIMPKKSVRSELSFADQAKEMKTLITPYENTFRSSRDIDALTLDELEAFMTSIKSSLLLLTSSSGMLSKTKSLKNDFKSSFKTSLKHFSTVMSPSDRINLTTNIFAIENAAESLSVAFIVRTNRYLNQYLDKAISFGHEHIKLLKKG